MRLHESHLHADDGSLQAIVTVFKPRMFDPIVKHIWGRANARTVMEMFKKVPSEIAVVLAYYPKLKHSVLLNADLFSKDKDMDLSHIYANRDEAKASALPIRMVAPLPGIMPDDSVVKFVTIESIKDVLDADERAVLLFGPDQQELLQCVVDHPALFDFNPMVLSGVPTADYSAQWESATYSLERVAFASLVNDLVERGRVASALADQNTTPYEKEKKQYTRKDGGVKELKDVRIAGSATLEEEESVVE